MKKILIITIILTLFSSSLFAQNANQLQRLKKRVAVFEFEDKTDHRVRWYTGQSVGSGMADMLVTELVKSGKYRVMERQAIDKIIEEQSLGVSGAVTPQSAAEVGKLLGVELAIVASVTEFGHSESDLSVGTRSSKTLLKSVSIKSNKATVAVDLRFVNTTTGEIMAAENVRENESKSGLGLGTQDFNFDNQSKFDESLVGKATRKAIESIMKKIDSQMASVPWQAKIIRVSGNTVYINSGSEAGVQVGDVFDVYSKGEELIDPDTGISLGSEEAKIGEIGVTDNNIGNGKASKCVIKSGSGFDSGFLVRMK